MPKNSSRKTAARQRAARRGERYTRALRVVGGIGSLEDLVVARPDTTDDGVGWAQDLWQIRRLQDIVESRGWVAPAHAHDEFADDGCASTVDVCWEYPAPSASSCGNTTNQLPDVLDDEGPRNPECSVGWDEQRGLVAKVQTAGNWGGCRLHRTDLHIVPIAEAAARHRLPRLLTTVERAARTIDPAQLIDCTLRGPCGRRVRQRLRHLDRVNAWTGAMVAAARQFSAAEMAELQVWEGEHLGGRALKADGEPFGTSDWPGWAPLIGPAPWDERPVLHASEDADPAETDPGPVPVPSPDNDGVPIDLLRPVLNSRGLSAGACGLWSMLVSYYWSCEDDRTITQLHAHRPDDVTETDMLLAELTAAGMISISDTEVVTINPDKLGVIAPPRP